MPKIVSFDGDDIVSTYEEEAAIVVHEMARAIRSYVAGNPTQVDLTMVDKLMQLAKVVRDHNSARNKAWKALASIDR